jgi:hypothetical protein
MIFDNNEFSLEGALSVEADTAGLDSLIAVEEELFAGTEDAGLRCILFLLSVSLLSPPSARIDFPMEEPTDTAKTNKTKHAVIHRLDI